MGLQETRHRPYEQCALANTGVSTFASRTSPSTDQKLQKSLHLAHADKIEIKNLLPF
jgi:hypothetical protein